MNSRDRSGIDSWLSEHSNPSVIGLCLDFGVNPGDISDLVLNSDYEWLRYGVWRIMAAAEERLFTSVTGLRDLLIRCERITGAAIETAPSDESLDSWIAG